MSGLPAPLAAPMWSHVQPTKVRAGRPSNRGHVAPACRHDTTDRALYPSPSTCTGSLPHGATDPAAGTDRPEEGTGGVACRGRVSDSHRYARAGRGRPFAAAPFGREPRVTPQHTSTDRGFYSLASPGGSEARWVLTRELHGRDSARRLCTC